MWENDKYKNLNSLFIRILLNRKNGYGILKIINEYSYEGIF